MIADSPWFKGNDVGTKVAYANTTAALATNVSKYDRKTLEELVRHFNCTLGYHEKKPDIYKCSKSLSSDLWYEETNSEGMPELGL